jgi:hypothetical protein
VANFQKNGRNVHGEVLAVPAGAVYEIGVWGPLDTYVTPPRELDVVASPAVAGVRVERGSMLTGQNVRVWKVAGLKSGSVTLVAKNGAGAVWTQVTLAVGPSGGAGASPWTVTRASLTDKNGVVQAKYPPSPAIVALISLMNQGTGGALKAGIGLLESAGRSGTLYEHTGGVALDIFRNKVNDAQRRQAHNLIRFFVRNRAALGWRNMFYENWGFAQGGPQGPAANHNDHIHIDWMDFSTLKFDGANRLDRSKWTELTWPEAARVGTAVDTPSNVALVRAAWNDTTSPLLEDADIPRLYSGG